VGPKKKKKKSGFMAERQGEVNRKGNFLNLLSLSAARGGGKRKGRMEPSLLPKNDRRSRNGSPTIRRTMETKTLGGDKQTFPF